MFLIIFGYNDLGGAFLGRKRGSGKRISPKQFFFDFTDFGSNSKLQH
jgi:hypothetical protein